MQLENFKRIVTTFADENSDLDVDGDGTLLLGIRGIEVVAQIKLDPHGLKVEHEGFEWTAEEWIFSYLAKLDRLADRIISSISPPPHYVSPSGEVLNSENQTNERCDDARKEFLARLSQPSVDKTLIYFLTSDAGEGKTSLIEKISVDQAKAFKTKETSRLILPVPLAGRPFLRFDDAVIASLSNQYRFPFLYYDSFLELVKMGAIVPAFDGYEEMLAQSNSGEAISAIGDLVDQLSSSGTLLVAARTAYFDSSLSSQSKLLDSVREKQNVEIRRFALNRWSREVFLKYAEKRNVTEPEELYDKVVDRLKGKDDRQNKTDDPVNKQDHPVLTRAVLVRRLLDVAEEEKDLDPFLQRLGQSQTDYFFDFVEGIVDREVRLKWIDTSGTENSALLTRDEHHELLSELALEMWVNGVDALGFDVVRLVVQIYCEEKGKTPTVQRQINNRINDHSLLRLDHSAGSAKRIRFDHEHFKAFYLGQALARALDSMDDLKARLILDARQLSEPVIEEVARYLTSPEVSAIPSNKLFDDLHELSSGKQHASYIRENCGALMLELAERLDDSHLITGVSFPTNALDQRRLRDLKVSNSFFNSTRLSGSNITNCTFTKCRFTELEFSNALSLDGTIFDDCIFDSVSIGNDSDDEYRKFFNPDKVKAILISHGFKLKSQQEMICENSDPTTMDRDMKTALRFIRMFTRSTSVPESFARIRIGTESGRFFQTLLPKLQYARLVETTGERNNRLRLRVPLSTIDRLVENSGSSFEKFISDASVQ